MQPLAVGSQAHELPFAFDLDVTAKQKSRESEHVPDMPNTGSTVCLRSRLRETCRLVLAYCAKRAVLPTRSLSNYVDVIAWGEALT